MMGGVLSFFSGIFIYKQIYWVGCTLGTIALVFFVMGGTCPQKLEGFYHKWMKFAAILGAFNTKVLLGLLFFLCFTPVRVIITLLGKDPLKRKFEPSAKSYWEDHVDSHDGSKRYQSQY